jgi:SAM-dependent methyltransferase
MWNGAAGHAWVESQALLDDMFKPVEDLLVNAVANMKPDQRVLDIGCGTGATTLAVARRLGRAGHAVGIDISQPMIAKARARAQDDQLAASFICDDAQRYRFEPDSFDLLISRFGVMFFDDPVLALRQLRLAMRADGTCRFVVWRGPHDNPFMTAAERAAAPLLPDLPSRNPDDPGQFAWGNRSRIQGILKDSGWREIEIEPMDFACSFPTSELHRYMTRMGPLGRVLDGVEAGKREQIIETVRRAYDPYVQGDEVRYTAACWTVCARA